MNNGALQSQARCCGYWFFARTAFPKWCPNKACQQPYPLGFPPNEIAEQQAHYSPQES